MLSHSDTFEVTVDTISFILRLIGMDPRGLLFLNKLESIIKLLSLDGALSNYLPYNLILVKMFILHLISLSYTSCSNHQFQIAHFLEFTHTLNHKISCSLNTYSMLE